MRRVLVALHILYLRLTGGPLVTPIAVEDCQACAKLWEESWYDPQAVCPRHRKR